MTFVYGIFEYNYGFSSIFFCMYPGARILGIKRKVLKYEKFENETKKKL